MHYVVDAKLEVDATEKKAARVAKKARELGMKFPDQGKADTAARLMSIEDGVAHATVTLVQETNVSLYRRGQRQR
jgi:hypothetical protein